MADGRGRVREDEGWKGRREVVELDEIWRGSDRSSSFFFFFFCSVTVSYFGLILPNTSCLGFQREKGMKLSRSCVDFPFNSSSRVATRSLFSLLSHQVSVACKSHQDPNPQLSSSPPASFPTTMFPLSPLSLPLPLPTPTPTPSFPTPNLLPTGQPNKPILLPTTHHTPPTDSSSSSRRRGGRARSERVSKGGLFVCS